MSAKHTPGPWVLDTATRNFEMCTLHSVSNRPTEDGLGQRWVYVRPADLDQQWVAHSDEEQDANARLIAAAPDLLAALRLFFDEHDNTYDGEPMSMEMARFLECGRAAIAKAEGTAA